MTYKYDFVVNADQLDLEKLKENECKISIHDSIEATSYLDVDEFGSRADYFNITI